MSCTGAVTLAIPAPAALTYRIGAGLLRTRWRDGSVRQRRRYLHWPRLFAARWNVTAAQLHTLTLLLAQAGAETTLVPLVSGESAGAVADHSVRRTGDLEVSADADGIYQVTAELEQVSGTTPADITGWAPPCALLEGYRYAQASGIVRTPLEVAVVRQVQHYTTRPRIFELTWRVSWADLARLEAWINANGYAWHTLRLISGESASATPTDHTVRCASDLAVTVYPGGYADLTASLEQACTNELGAFEAEAADNLLTCVLAATDTIPLGLDDTALAAGWGDATDWGRDNP